MRPPMCVALLLFFVSNLLCTSRAVDLGDSGEEHGETGGNDGGGGGGVSKRSAPRALLNDWEHRVYSQSEHAVRLSSLQSSTSPPF